MFLSYRFLARPVTQKDQSTKTSFGRLVFLSYWYSFYRLNRLSFKRSWVLVCQRFKTRQHWLYFKFSNRMVKTYRFLFLEAPSSQMIKQAYLLNCLSSQLDSSFQSFHHFQSGWNSQLRSLRGFFLLNYVSWRWRTAYYPYLLAKYPRVVYKWTFYLRYRDYLTLPLKYLARYSKLLISSRYYSHFETNFKAFQQRTIKFQSVFFKKKHLVHLNRLKKLRIRLKNSFVTFLAKYPNNVIDFSTKQHRTHPENKRRQDLTLKLTNKVNKWLENPPPSRFRDWSVQPVYQLTLLTQPYVSLQDPTTVGIDAVFPTSDLDPFDEVYDELFEDQQDDTESV